MMKKVAFIIHRYGNEISGGAEYQCRNLAERLSPFYEVDVITSTATLVPWNDYYSEGSNVINGVRVIRFKAEKPKEDQIRNCFCSIGDYTDWIELCKVGPFCPQMMEYINEHASDYDVLITYSYQQFTAAITLMQKKTPVILIPTLHDEPRIYKQLYVNLISRAQAYIFQTEEEENLARRIANITNMSITGCQGMTEINTDYSKYSPDEDNYIIYIGRVTNTKNFKELNEYFIKYKNKKNNSNLKLIVIGDINVGFQLSYHKDIIYKGFVTEEEKNSYLERALCLILPSQRESLSIVILEAMLKRVPVLVNGFCEVTKAQCIRSNAGLWYENYLEFEAMVDWFLSHPEDRKEMGENGRKYVLEKYNWEVVTDNVRKLIEEVVNNKEA